MKLVEFWVLFGTSHVDFYYPDGSIESRSLTNFNEDTFDPSIVERVLVFISSDDIVSQLQQHITDNTKERIEDLIKRIRRLQNGISNIQTSLEDFLG
ncbi:MAG: hypothetical protein ACFFC7_29835 [Candidatus Hermodarchaeota archaeon]